MKIPKPLRARAPRLASFKTEKDLAIFLYVQYWFEGKTLGEIAKDRKVSAARIKELLDRFHICRRHRGQRMKKR